MKIDPTRLNLKIEEYNEDIKVNRCFKDQHFLLDGVLGNTYEELPNELQDAIELQDIKDRIRRDIDNVF